MDHLDHLAQATIQRIENGYYASVTGVTFASPESFVEAIRRAQTAGLTPVIAEIKPASPSAGVLRARADIYALAKGFQIAGAVGLSVLTEPIHFGGSLENLKEASASGLPTLMKDFLIDPIQLDACVACGASAVLLILTLFRRGHAHLTLDKMIAESHRRNLEILLEVNSLDEYEQAQQSKADMIGINNRDLATFEVDFDRTGEILRQAKKDRIVWALSGIETPEDLKRLLEAGADAFLIGTSLMRASDPAAKLRLLLRV
jgi:indole-3-glycerol phosphate synthase